jgi:hypothetical protein
MRITRLLSLFGILLVTALASHAADTNDVDELTTMLHDFLAGSGEKQIHQDFWAEELVYTSSNGTRFGKADIMANFAAAKDEESEEADGPATVYSGEDVQVQVYGTTAIVAFKLVGTNADGSIAQTYFNTGTFLKRDGTWKAVAWQATMIPKPEE